jgi:AbrB family looped-hinge helix DNA binding protein
MPASTLTSKGQLTLPKAIRDRLGLHEGDRAEFRVTADGRVVVEAATVDLRDLRGVLKNRGKQVSVEEMEEAVRRAFDRFVERGGDYADYLIVERCRAAGCERVASFDRGLGQEEGVFEP